MNYKLNGKEEGAAYLQLYRQLREDIVRGAFLYGERMPSKRLLAAETGCSVITAEHAYTLLEEEGYVQAKERSGYFVIYKEGDLYPAKEEEAEALLSAAPQAYDEGEFFPFPTYARTMRKVLSVYGERILTKSENAGTKELRSAIAAYLRRSRGMDVKEEQIVIGSGAEYLYSLIAQLLSLSVIAIEDPSYDKIRKVYEAHGIRCDALKMGRDGITSAELKRTRAKALHVTPFHSYPSGITASAGKRAEYLHWAQRKNGVIIEDDYDSEFTISKKAKDTIYGMTTRDDVIYMNTFSKTIAPSVRIGYMVLPFSLQKTFAKTLGFYACTVPVFEQLVLAEFISSGNFERHINRVRRRRRLSQQP